MSGFHPTKDEVSSEILDVNIVGGSASGTEYTEGDTDASITGTAMLWEDGSDTLRAVSAAKPLPVDIQDSTVAVTQSGTWDEVGINDSGNSITVDNGGTFAVQATAVGTVADDATTPGAPMMVGGQAKSPDGTDPGNVSAEDDVARVLTDLNRRLLVNDEHPRWWSYHSDGSTALTDASVAADPGDGFQLVITDIQFSNGSTTAMNMFLEEGATKIWGPVYLEAVNGRGYVWKGKKHVTASTALTVTTSASAAHSVEVLGYIQAV